MKAIHRALIGGSDHRNGNGRREVRLLASAPGPAAASPEERLIAATLESAGPLPSDELVSRVSSMLYREQRRQGVWADDLGVLGASLFAGDVEHALQAGNGRLWTIIEPGISTTDRRH